MRKDELLEIIKVKNKEIERQDKIIREINKTKYNKLMEKDIVFHLKNRNEELEAKLAEKEQLLNEYPYKNDVIEKQYQELKDGIKFRVENNITDDWEQLYHCIDVLCEKHKTRIRDIENSICNIEQLEQQLAEKEEERLDTWKDYKYYKNKCLRLENINQDKISFCIEKFEELKHISRLIYGEDVYIIGLIDNQIEQLKKEMK